MRRLLALVSILAGCHGAPTQAATDDPEQLAAALLGPRLLEPVERLRADFAAEVDPGAFPPRLMADGPNDLQNTELLRLRWIDGRVLVTARLVLGGTPHAFELWLERREGRWVVAGWEGTPGPVPPLPLPPAGPEVPAPLAGATFREPHGVVDLPVVPASGPTSAPAVSPIVVHIKAPAVEGACDPLALRRALERLVPRLRECARDTPGGAAPRAGRLTFEVGIDAEGRPTEVRLVEATVLQGGLSACVSELLGGMSPGAGGPCQAKLAVTWTPTEER